MKNNIRLHHFKFIFSGLIIFLILMIIVTFTLRNISSSDSNILHLQQLGFFDAVCAVTSTFIGIGFMALISSIIGYKFKSKK